MTLSLDRINKARKAGYDDDTIIESIQRRDPQFAERITKARNAGYDSATIMQSIEKRLNTPVNTQSQAPKEENVKPLYTKQQNGLIESFQRGLRGSVSGEAANIANHVKPEQLEDPTWWESLVESAGTITGDLPYYAAGASLGAALGATGGPLGSFVGGGFGSFALPAFLKESLRQYKDYVEQGNDLSFGEFLQRADKVANKTLTEGAFGVILGQVSKAIPYLKDIPTIGKLFDSKIAQKAASITAETAALATIPPITEGRLPQGQDYAHALALVLGFNALHLPAEVRERIQKRGTESGKSPVEFAKEILSENRQENIDLKREITKNTLNEVEGGNRKKLAEEAFARDMIRTPQQLEEFIKEYDDIWPGIQGDVREKNRKFLNKYANKNENIKNVKPLEGKPVVNVKPSAERTLEIGRTQKREAKHEGNKAKLKEAERRIGMAKRKIERQANQKTEAFKENVKPLYIEEEKVKTSSYNVKPKEKTVTKNAEKPVVEPIIETTGQGAAQRLEEAQTRFQRVKENVKAGTKVVAEGLRHPIRSTAEMAQSSKALGSKINKEVFNFLAPLENLEANTPVGERVSSKVKQAQSSASDINQVLTKGVFDQTTNTFKSGSLQDVYAGNVWKKFTKGLKPQNYSVEEFNEYRHSVESLKRQKRGLKSGIDTAIAEKDVARLKQKYGPIYQRLKEFNKGVLDHYGKDMLTPKTRAEWTKEPHTSLYRMMDWGSDAAVKEGSLQPKKWWQKAKGSGRKHLPGTESDVQNVAMLISNAKKNDSILQYKKAVEKGELPGKIVGSKNKELPSKLIEDLEMDPENSELAETLYNQSRKDAWTPQPGRIRGWENGKAFEIEVPDDIYQVFNTMAPRDNGFFTKLLRNANRALSIGIVREPLKTISIVGRDAFSAVIYSKTNHWPLVNNLKAMTDIYKDSHSYNQFKSLGGDTYAARINSRSDRIRTVDEIAKIDPHAVVVPFKKLGSFLQKFGDSIAVSVPFAEYQSALKKYGDTPEGRALAIMESKGVTYDPGKKGGNKIVQGLADISTFFNVILQEPGMIAKHMNSPTFWAKGLAYITAPSLLLHMYNEGNPDYDDMNPVYKASCWHFYTPEHHYAVPIPWLLGALFKSAPEAFYDFARGQGGDAFKGLISYIVEQQTPGWNPIITAAVEQSTGKTLHSPVSLVLLPFYETETNKPEVVPKRLQHLPPEQQFTNRTSQLARWYGKLTGSSPVKVERLVKTFGGNIASDSLAITDELAYQSGAADDMRPEKKNAYIFGNWIDGNVASQTRFTGEFYAKLEEATMLRKREEPSDYEILNEYNKRIKKNLKLYRETYDTKMDPKQKRIKLDKIQKETNAMYKRAVEEANKRGKNAKSKSNKR